MDNNGDCTSKAANFNCVIMIYNNALSSQYGDFIGISGTAPVTSKPLPTKQNYEAGSFGRVFAKKINENSIIEIDGKQAKTVNTKLYRLVFVNWTISGPKENRYKNGILSPGVYNQNTFEIDRVMIEDGVDLKKVLPNPLEYWQGR